MSKPKHTPGPWSRVNGYNIFSDLGADSGDGYKAPENDGWLIATVETGSVTNDDGELVEIGHGVVRANARLIAAAPELLEALIAVFECIEDTHIQGLPGSPLEKARAAIAKAAGEQND